MALADVLILGASGYGGGELLRLLAAHPHIGSIAGLSRSHAGKPFHAQHPNLRGVLPGQFIAEADWGALAQSECPVVFAALPHGEFARQYRDLQSQWTAAGLADRLTVIDLSGDFRLADASEFQRAYHGEHPCPEHLGTFVYGLSEFRRAVLPGARRIANPGCFATALELGLLPLADLPRELRPGFVAISAVTGSSGSGATPGEGTHHPLRAHDFRAYKVLAHQHEAEIERMAREQGHAPRLAFTPHSAPLVRGIHATLQFEFPPDGAEALRDAFRLRYPDAGFVRLIDTPPRLAAVNGSNFVDMQLTVRDGLACVLVALDNLVKGMAGQAVQNLNLALGWPEAAGLRQPALWPG